MKAGILAMLLSFLAGCHMLPARQSALPGHSSTVAVATTSSPAVVRYDRYLLLNTLPLNDQRDPLNQMVDVTIPAALHPTLAEAMRYLLRDSGYALCFPSSQRQLLFDQPLPLVQAHIGPVKLRDALQMLAGSEWRLEIDRLYRIVCFHLQPRSGERNA